MIRKSNFDMPVHSMPFGHWCAPMKFESIKSVAYRIQYE
jgi:hypothetical protein